MATAAAASPSSVDGNSPSPYRRFSTRHRSRNAGASANGAAGSGAGMGETESPARPMQYGAFFKHFDDVPKEYQQTATASTFDEKLFEVNDKDEAAARFTDLYYALLFLGVMYFSTLPSWVLLSGNYLCCDQINSTARKACVQVGRSNDTFGCFDGIVNGTPVATTEIYQVSECALSIVVLVVDVNPREFSFRVDCAHCRLLASLQICSYFLCLVECAHKDKFRCTLLGSQHRFIWGCATFLDCHVQSGLGKCVHPYHQATVPGSLRLDHYRGVHGVRV